MFIWLSSIIIMKVAISTPKSSQQVPGPIPLVRIKKSEEEDQNKHLQIEMKSNPGQASSQKYKKSILIFRHGSVEDFLEWKKDLESVFEGQAIRTAPAKFAMTKRLLEGDPLIQFENAIALHGEETDEHFQQVMRDLILYVFPRKALRIQKRYMRRQMRKPQSMKVRDFVARVQEINNCLSQFPPFGDAQTLPEDEILDILESAVPNSWQREFVKTGYDPMENDVKEFIDRSERLELTEQLDPKSKVNNNNSNNSNKNNKKKKGNGQGTRSNHHRSEGNNQGSQWSAKSSEEAKDCPLHGKGTHPMGKCKVLKAQAEKMRANYMAKSQEQKSEERKNKRKFNSGHLTKDEVNAIIDSKLKARKVKTNKSNSDSSSDSSDEEEQLNNFE